jgi:hypothetical protein
MQELVRKSGIDYSNTYCNLLKLKEAGIVEKGFIDKRLCWRRVSPSNQAIVFQHSGSVEKQDAIEFVKTHEGGFVSLEEFSGRFKDVNQFRFGRETGIARYSQKGNTYLVFKGPKVAHGHSSNTDFERFISNRLGRDWYLPGNEPRNDRNSAIHRMVDADRRAREDKIAHPSVIVDDVSFPAGMGRFSDLLAYVKGRLTAYPKTNLVVLWNELVKYYGFVDHDDIGVFNIAWASNYKEIVRWLEFSPKVRSNLKLSYLTFYRSVTP